MNPETSRKGLIEAAGDLVSGERNREYGDPSDNLGRTARLWSAYLGTELTSEQVAGCMILLKMARLAHGPSKDSWVDIIGYAAIGGEVDLRDLPR